MPIEETILVRVAVPQTEIDSRKITIQLGQIEAIARTVPVTMMSPSLKSLRITIPCTINEYLEVISFSLERLRHTEPFHPAK